MHGVESKAVLVAAKELGFFIKSASSVLPRDSIEPIRKLLPSPARAGKNLDEATELVIAAFREAKLRGREDWRHMRISVLKNRLLDLTNRSFDEGHYGAESIQNFVALLPDLLSIDTTVSPWAVTLLNADHLVPDVVPSPESGAPTKRIRPDLWRAVLDYASKSPFVWDPDIGVARFASSKAGEIPMPTVDKSAVHAWRVDFANRNGLADDPTVREWVDRDYAARFLSPPLQRAWNDYTRQQVVEILTAFFTSHDLEVPTDLLVEPDELERFRTKASDAERQTEDLRRLIMRCVAVMDRAELGQLQINAATVARALQVSDT